MQAPSLVAVFGLLAGQQPAFLPCCYGTCSGLHYSFSLFKRTSIYESLPRQSKNWGSRNICPPSGQATLFQRDEEGS